MTKILSWETEYGPLPARVKVCGMMDRGKASGARPTEQNQNYHLPFQISSEINWQVEDIIRIPIYY